MVIDGISGDFALRLVQYRLMFPNKYEWSRHWSRWSPVYNSYVENFAGDLRSAGVSGYLQMRVLDKGEWIFSAPIKLGLV